MNDTLNFKLENFKSKAKQKAKAVYTEIKKDVKYGLDWVSENKEALVILVPATVAGVAEIRKCNDRIQDRIERNKKKLKVHDPISNTWIPIKRPLRKNEQLIFAARRLDHEPVMVILRDLNLI